MAGKAWMSLGIADGSYNFRSNLQFFILNLVLLAVLANIIGLACNSQIKFACGTQNMLKTELLYFSSSKVLLPE
jgi:hypothetical protein